MILKLTAVALAAMAFGNARADDGFGLKFSGFGTLSAVHSSERQADFVGRSSQPNGAGFTRSTSLDPDSKLGGQVAATVTDKLSAVLQVVTQHQYDNSYTPQIEWANLKYQWTPELSVRLGRIAAPTFMLSQSRLVGYSNPWIRPPTEVYGLNPITSNDGVDASYRSNLGGANNTFQAYAGGSALKLSGGGTVKSKSAWGWNDSIESGALTLRLAYFSGSTSLDYPGINALIGGLNQFAAGANAVSVPAFQVAGMQAGALSEKYEVEGIKTKIFTVGANYDPGDWFVSAEFAAERFTHGFFSNTNGWYVSGGYRFGSLTPYATYGSSKAQTKAEQGISTAGADALAPAAAALNGGVNAVLAGFSQSQRSAAVGLRWDFMTNLALKGQYDHISLGNHSAGYLGNVQPGFVPGGKLNVVSVAVDFVF